MSETAADLGRLREILDQIVQHQAARVVNPNGAVGGNWSLPASDEEGMTALMLQEEAGARWAGLDVDTRAVVLNRLAINDLARGDVAGAKGKLEQALREPPADPGVLAALHYNLFQTLLTTCRGQPAVGEAAAKHYQKAVELDLFLAEFAPDYQLVRVLDGGSHGGLYQVRDADGKDFLIRVLTSRPESPTAAEMLELEAQTLTGWDHPNLAKVNAYRHGEFRRPFLVLEWFEGVDLEHAVKSFFANGRQATVYKALHELKPLLSTLTYLHTHDPHHPWIVRTINPRDVYLTKGRGMLLTDFGLDEPITRLSGDDMMYLSPEVRAGRPAGPPADVYSLGRLVCFILTGRPDLIAELEPPVTEVLERATAVNPEERFQKVEEFQAALQAALGRLTRVTLEVLEGPYKDRTFKFDRYRTFTVGRGATADFCLVDDAQISRRHFQVVVQADGVRLRDLLSSNGTFVNGERVTEVPLSGGETVQAGESVMRVRIDFPSSLVSQVGPSDSAVFQTAPAEAVGGSLPMPVPVVVEAQPADPTSGPALGEEVVTPQPEPDTVDSDAFVSGTTPPSPNDLVDVDDLAPAQPVEPEPKPGAGG